MKIRHKGTVKNTAVYLALGVGADGNWDVVGIWSEGAKFWLRVMNDLRNCRVEDILIAAVDGLEGFDQSSLGGNIR